MPDVFCPTCGKESIVIKEAVYDGFTRVGERLKCAVCGHIFEPPNAPDEVEQPKVAKLPSIFSEDDRPAQVRLFDEGENRVICRYCINYTVNPFRQWCGFHKKEVEATDTCQQFQAK